MKSDISKRQHLLSPTIGELREPMDKHDAGTLLTLESGLQHVRCYAVGFYKEGLNPGRESVFAILHICSIPSCQANCPPHFLHL